MWQCLHLLAKLFYHSWWMLPASLPHCRQNYHEHNGHKAEDSHHWESHRVEEVHQRGNKYSWRAKNHAADAQPYSCNLCRIHLAYIDRNDNELNGSRKFHHEHHHQSRYLSCRPGMISSTDSSPLIEEQHGQCANEGDAGSREEKPFTFERRDKGDCKEVGY